MPTYQYSCNDCGHFFETFQNFSDNSLTVCPACEGRLRKVFNAVGVVFKGSGFYRNDSRSQKNGAEAGAATATKESSEKGSEKGSDKSPSESKPAAKSDSSSGSSSGSGSTSAAAAPV